MNVAAEFRYPYNGTESEREVVAAMLEVGKKYAVRKIHVYPYRTEVYLMGIEIPLNSVFFDFWRDGEPYDPAEDRTNWKF